MGCGECRPLFGGEVWDSEFSAASPRRVAGLGSRDRGVWGPHGSRNSRGFGFSAPGCWRGRTRKPGGTFAQPEPLRFLEAHGTSAIQFERVAPVWLALQITTSEPPVLQITRLSSRSFPTDGDFAVSGTSSQSRCCDAARHWEA